MRPAADQRPQRYSPRTNYQDGGRQAFRHSRTSVGAVHHPHNSLGAAGHWIHLLTVAAPLVIAEAIKDPDKKWRALRLASVGGAVLSEAAWTLKIAHDKKKNEEARAALESCEERPRSRQKCTPETAR